MSREIKFRGKRVDNGEWLYGSLMISKFKDNKNPKYYISQFLGNYTYDHKVHPETVGQFTGLHDCEGKEIYEGDVVSVHHVDVGTSSVGIVKFSNGAFDIEFENTPDETCYFDYENSTVLGSIHSNPNILNGGK